MAKATYEQHSAIIQRADVLLFIEAQAAAHEHFAAIVETDNYAAGYSAGYLKALATVAAALGAKSEADQIIKNVQQLVKGGSHG